MFPDADTTTSLARGSRPGELIRAMPTDIAGRVEAALEGLGMTRLPADVELMEAGGTLVAWVGARQTMIDHAPARHVARSVEQLARHLRLARDEETRAALMTLAGRPSDDPPAWALLAPRILHDLLKHADWTPQRFLQALDLPGLRGGAGVVALRLSSPACASHGPAVVTAKLQGDELRVRVELASRLHVIAGRTSTCVIRGFDNETIAMSLGGRLADEMVDHPLLKDPSYRIVSGHVVQKHMRAWFKMPWAPLEPLPPELARTFPHNPSTSRSAVAWG